MSLENCPTTCDAPNLRSHPLGVTNQGGGAGDPCQDRGRPGRGHPVGAGGLEGAPPRVCPEWQTVPSSGPVPSCGWSPLPASCVPGVNPRELGHWGAFFPEAEGRPRQPAPCIHDVAITFKASPRGGGVLRGRGKGEVSNPLASLSAMVPPG